MLSAIEPLEAEAAIGGSVATPSAPGEVVGAAGSNQTLVGNSTLQPSGDTDSAGSAEAFEYKAAAGGTVESISLYVNSGNTANSIVVGLYLNASGRPGALLTEATIDAPAVHAWNTVNVPPAIVNVGEDYWLAALAPSGTLALRDRASGGGPTQNSKSSSLDALPRHGWVGAPG